MLVLGRKAGEVIKIGDDIKIMVVDVKYGQVKIGIDAPKNMNIVRAEIAGRETKQKPCNP